MESLHDHKRLLSEMVVITIVNCYEERRGTLERGNYRGLLQIRFWKKSTELLKVDRTTG